ALGAQRNIKILGVFTRLWRRDGTDRYLDLLPRVWCWLKRDLAHPALAPLRAWVETEAPAPTPEIIAAIRSRPSGPGGRSQPRRAAPTDAAQALDTAMVLGAGMGARMRPLTNTTPKPLIEIGGASLLEHTLKRAEESGVGRAVVNIHHLAPQMQRFASLWNERGRAPELTVSDETVKLMETGGGVVKALPLLKRDAFFVLNSDNLWTGAAPLGPLRAAWDPSRMDALLLLCPVGGAHGYTRRGDFSLDSEGRLVRRGERPQAPLVFTGAQILSKAALKGAPDEPFSLNVVWDALIAKGRAYGVLHLGEWADAGDIAKLKTAEAMLEGARKPLAPGVVWPLTPEAAYELDRRAAEAAAEAASDASLRDLERRARAAEIAAAREPEPEPDPAPAAAAPAARAFAAGAAASFAAKPAQPAPADEAAPAEAALTETAPAEEAAAEPPHYEPAITEPEPKEPSPHGQAAQGATFQDSALQDSALQDATLQDAALQDAALQDAALQDAAPEQEARRDAELEAASLEDPALEDHHVEDPAPDEAENTPAARFEDALADLPVDAAGAPTPDAAPRFEDVLAAHPEDRLAAPEEHPASPVAARRTQRGWEREAGSEPPLLLSNALLAEPPEHQPSGGGVGESAEDRLSAAEYDFEEADPYDDEAYIDEYDDVIDDEDLQDDAFDGAETMGRGDIAHQQETMGHQGRGDDGYDDDGDGFGSEAREAAFDGDDLSGLDLPDLPADEADLGGLDLPDLDSPGPAETPAWGAPEDRGARRRD
ncbi:MAG: sugar phosphate nucleotidyltransferase, partial [Pseudomonadota bacterium]